MITLYLHPTCSTCKKALKFLDARGAVYEVKSIKENPPSLKELESMLEFYHGNIKALFNTSGELYRSLGLSSKLVSLSKEEALGLLAAHGMLVKRPFILSPSAGRVGFKEDQWLKEFA